MGNCITSSTKTQKKSSSFEVFAHASETSNESYRSTSSHLHYLMTKEIRRRNVFKDYKVIKVIGEGSMGSVSVVQKKRYDSAHLTPHYDQCFFVDFFLSFKKKLSNDHHAHHHHGHAHQYALKTLRVKINLDPAAIKELRNEIEILQSLDHPNIVRAIETYEYQNQIAIVMELCAGGDLYSQDPYTEARAQHIVRQITSAVSYMHRCGIMHRGQLFPEMGALIVSFSSSLKVVILVILSVF
jgi:serine/threonine protein kinase